MLSSSSSGMNAEGSERATLPPHTHTRKIAGKPHTWASHLRLWLPGPLYNGLFPWLLQSSALYITSTIFARDVLTIFPILSEADIFPLHRNRWRYPIWEPGHVSVLLWGTRTFARSPITGMDRFSILLRVFYTFEAAKTALPPNGAYWKSSLMILYVRMLIARADVAAVLIGTEIWNMQSKTSHIQVSESSLPVSSPSFHHAEIHLATCSRKHHSHSLSQHHPGNINISGTFPPFSIGYW